MSSMGGLSSMQKSAGNRSGFVPLCLFTLIFSLGIPIYGKAEDEGMESPEIIVISDSYMDWNADEAYCQQKGGSLPLINGSASLDYDQVITPGTAKIDGFGEVDTKDRTTPWPSDLPTDSYWAGTVDSEDSEYSWRVSEHGGKVSVNFNILSNFNRVVCVR